MMIVEYRCIKLVIGATRIPIFFITAERENGTGSIYGRDLDESNGNSGDENNKSCKSNCYKEYTLVSSNIVDLLILSSLAIGRNWCQAALHSDTTYMLDAKDGNFIVDKLN